MRARERHLLYKEAADLEETSPRQALKAYRHLEAANRPFGTRIFLTAIACPIIAFLITYGASSLFDSHQTWVGILILIVVGFVPPLTLFERRFEEQQAQHSGQSLHYPAILGHALGNAVQEFLLKFVILFAVLVYGGLMACPILILISVPFHFLVGTPFYWQSPDTSLPMYVQMSVAGFCMVTFYLACMTGIFLDVPPEQVLFRVPELAKYMPKAMRPMAGEMLPFVTGLAVGYALYGAGFSIPYEYAGAGLAENSFAGVMLGLYYSRRLERDFIFGNVLRIAKARCLIRLGRQDEASYILRGLTEEVRYPPKFSRTSIIKHLGTALTCFILDLDRYRQQKGLPADQPVLEEVASNRLTEGLSSCWTHYPDEPLIDYPYQHIYTAARALETVDARYIDIYANSIDKTRWLVGLGDDESIGGLIHMLGG